MPEVYYAHGEPLNCKGPIFSFETMPLPLSGAEPDLAPGVEATVIDRIDVQATLDALPPRYRVPLVLYTYEEYSVAQIAETLGLSASAVKMRLSRARDKFRRAYGQEKNR